MPEAWRNFRRQNYFLDVVLPGGRRPRDVTWRGAAGALLPGGTPVMGERDSGRGFMASNPALSALMGLFDRDPYRGAQASGDAYSGVQQMGPPSSLAAYGPATPYGGEGDPNFVGPPSPEAYAGNPASPGFVGPPAPDMQRYQGAAGRAGATSAGPTSRGQALDPTGSLLSRSGSTNPIRLSGTERFNRGLQKT